jgi:hypothetical protein
MVQSDWPRANPTQECIIYSTNKEYIGIHENRVDQDSVVTGWESMYKPISVTLPTNYIRGSGALIANQS